MEGALEERLSVMSKKKMTPYDQTIYTVFIPYLIRVVFKVRTLMVLLFVAATSFFFTLFTCLPMVSYQPIMVRSSSFE